MKMRKHILMIIFISFSLYATHCYSNNENVWQQFVAKPSMSSNYNQCKKQIQDAVSSSQGSNKLLKNEFINNDHLFKSFLALIKNQNKNAARLGFQLLPLTDGSKKEDLKISLGTLIKNDARFFLYSLKEYNIGNEELPGLLLNFGPKYVDKVEKKISETENRTHAIQEVNNKDLHLMKEKCLRILKARYEKLLNIKKEL